ncbi:MAG: hypothetical protein R3F55_25440 [Alphaproteobacteria bacterium]
MPFPCRTLCVLAWMLPLLAGPARADSLFLTLGDALDNRVAEMVAHFDPLPLIGPARHHPTRVTDQATFLALVGSLGQGDVLYLNTHSNTMCVGLSENETLTFDAIGCALRDGPADSRRVPPRLLAVVVDGCMANAVHGDFARVSQAFNGELVIGWATVTNSIAHISAMYDILERLFVEGLPLARTPSDRTPALVGRPYLYAPTAYYGETMAAVATHLAQRLAAGAEPDLGRDTYSAEACGADKPDDDEQCRAFFEENPYFCVIPPMNEETDESAYRTMFDRCCVY